MKNLRSGEPAMSTNARELAVEVLANCASKYVIPRTNTEPADIESAISNAERLIENHTATLRARISELERERDALSLEKVNVSIQLAAASRFTYDQESGWEIPAEPNPMHADTFVEALQLFMEMVDREDKKQRDALTAAHTALEGLLNVFRTHAPVDVYERHTKAVDAARAALADTTEQPSVREPNAPAPNKELEEL